MYDVCWMQGVREGSVFTPYRERFAYDIANLRYRYLAGLEDEREPAYAHYFFYKEVVYIYYYIDTNYSKH